MKKHFSLFSLLSVSLITGCQTGTISGKVLDPFTNKAVPKAKLQLIGTPNVTQANDAGVFKFSESVSLEKYSLRTGKNRYSQSKIELELKEDAPDANVTVYIFPKTGMKPGLFLGSDTGAVKIRNIWNGFDVKCEGNSFAYRTFMRNVKTKKKLKLPVPHSQSQDVNAIFYQASANQSPISAMTYPAKTSSPRRLKCDDLRGQRKVVTGEIEPSKGKALNISYVSQGAFRMQDKLPNGKQLIQFSQSGKLLATYYFDVK